MKLLVLLLGLFSTTLGTNNKGKPNIVFFLADDFGYGDLSSFGHPTQEPGGADRLAQEGLRFTQMYSTSVYCTPSRASILTGRLPLRTGMYGETSVLLHCHSGGLPMDEITVADALKSGGYRTGMVGKWHQGINENVYNDGLYLPHNRGFDYVGTLLPYTLVWRCDNTQRHMTKPHTGHCYVYYNDTIIQQPINLQNLTSAIVLDSKAFLYDMAERDEPFFLYVSLPQVHTPMFNNAKFKGKSRRGIYGDQVNEMNWVVSEVMDTIDKLGFRENTLTIFTSDHGPHLEICGEGGYQGPFRGGKGYFLEGGVRVPAIAHWPGKIDAGSVTATVTSLMDLFSTFLTLASVDLPSDRIIDGKDFSHLFTNHNAAVAHDVLYFYCDKNLIAVRYKQYKIYMMSVPEHIDYVKSKNCLEGGFPSQNLMGGSCHRAEYLDEPWIYDVEADPKEEYKLSSIPQEVLDELESLIINHQKELVPREPVLTMKRCHKKNIPCCNPPYCVCNYHPQI